MLRKVSHGLRLRDGSDRGAGSRCPDPCPLGTARIACRHSGIPMVLGHAHLLPPPLMPVPKTNLNRELSKSKRRLNKLLIILRTHGGTMLKAIRNPKITMARTTNAFKTGSQVESSTHSVASTIVVRAMEIPNAYGIMEKPAPHFCSSSLPHSPQKTKLASGG